MDNQLAVLYQLSNRWRTSAARLKRHAAKIMSSYRAHDVDRFEAMANTELAHANDLEDLLGVVHVAITEIPEMDMHEMSAEGRSHLIHWEGQKLSAYQDVAGLWTIGVGHLLTRSEIHSGKIYLHGNAIHWRHGITQDQAMQLLVQDLGRIEAIVNASVIVSLNQNQFDCLCSFTFNVGPNAFRNSTLLKKLNAREYDAVPTQLARWVYAGGQKIDGLANRRRSEAKLWSKAT